MNMKYLILFIFIILNIISFNKYGNRIKQFVYILCFFIYSNFNGLYYSIKYKITNKNYKIHPVGINKLLKTKATQINSNEIKKDKCIYLFNHRSWADLWIDYDIVGGASYISRNIMKYVIGGQSLLASTTKNVIYFNRDNKTKDNRKILYDKIIKRLDERNIVLYPEGTRNTTNKPLPLKMGIIKLAYQNKIPVQIIICKNKEKVFSFKKLSYQTNIECPYYVSGVIYPESFKSLDEFIEKVKIKWNESWNKIY